MRFREEVAIVTGAGRGIGQTIACLLAERGRVVVADLDLARLVSDGRGNQAAGGKAIAMQVDVAEPSQVERMIRETITALGRLDVLREQRGSRSEQAVLDHDARAVGAATPRQLDRDFPVRSGRRHARW